MSVGRNMAEIKRALLALQTTTEHSVACPMNWQPGDKVIVPTPKSVDALEGRLGSDLEMVDFYLAKKSL